MPQVYYVGLLAGTNDMDLLRSTGVGRDINRHRYTCEELREQLTRPVVRSLAKLIRFRNTHPAFEGEFNILPSDDRSIRMEWRHDSHWARLDADFKTMAAVIMHSITDGEHKFAITPGGSLEVQQ